MAAAEVCKNPTLAEFLTNLSDTRRRIAWQRKWDQIYRFFTDNEFQVQYSYQHLTIIETIADRDQHRAKQEMTEHLELINFAMNHS